MSALLPLLEGVSERSERGCGSVCCAFQPDANPSLMMMDLIYTFVLSGSSVEPDNTNGSKSNHQHKRGFWRQVELRNLTYD